MTKEMNMEKFVTIQQAAECLAVSEDTIRRMLPKLGAVDMADGKAKKRLIRIPVRSLEAYLDGCLILPPLTTRKAVASADYKIARRRA